MDMPNYNLWEGIPSHLQDMIFDKLKSTKDCLQFGAVCQTWHSTLKHNQFRHITCTSLLLIPDAAVDSNTSRLLDITNNQVLDTKLTVPYNKRFCGSSRGWLVATNEDWSITLYKPFSTNCQSVRLPCLVPPTPEDMSPFYDYFIQKVLITSDPLTNPDECVVVITSLYLGGIAFIRLTKDLTWTLIKETDAASFFDFIFRGDYLYPISDSGEIYRYKLNNDSPHDSTSTLFIPGDGVDPRMVTRYIVNLHDGRAILVWRYYKKIGDPILPKTFRFELTVVDIDRQRKHPRRVKCLGDRAIFLGDNDSVCVKASNFNGCRSNCIYFTNDQEYDVCLADGEEMIFDLGVNDIQTKEFEFHFNMNSTILQALKSRPPIWIVPTFNAY